MDGQVDVPMDTRLRVLFALEREKCAPDYDYAVLTLLKADAEVQVTRPAPRAAAS